MTPSPSALHSARSSSMEGWGLDPESDLGQIEEAARRTAYEYDGKRISRGEAISLLGRRSYLAGISRSAFHHTSVQLTPEEKPVYFDSSRLFEAGRRGTT